MNILSVLGIINFIGGIILFVNKNDIINTIFSVILIMSWPFVGYYIYKYFKN